MAFTIVGNGRAILDVDANDVLQPDVVGSTNIVGDTFSSDLVFEGDQLVIQLHNTGQTIRVNKGAVALINLINSIPREGGAPIDVPMPSIGTFTLNTAPIPPVELVNDPYITTPVQWGDTPVRWGDLDFDDDMLDTFMPLPEGAIE